MLILNNSELKIEGILITNFKTSYVDIKTGPKLIGSKGFDISKHHMLILNYKTGNCGKLLIHFKTSYVDLKHKRKIKDFL